MSFRPITTFLIASLVAHAAFAVSVYLPLWNDQASKDGTVMISYVAETKPVPEEKREKIFEKFESTGSTGLGLSISRDLIEKLGGKLWYEHTASGHPNFKFSLPK